MLVLIIAASCAENDGRRRKPDPRIAAAGGCLNDSTDQEIFDENGKAYYEYVPCDGQQAGQQNQISEKSPCVNDSMEAERFDEQGNVYYIKVPCP